MAYLQFTCHQTRTKSETALGCRKGDWRDMVEKRKLLVMSEGPGWGGLGKFSALRKAMQWSHVPEFLEHSSRNVTVNCEVNAPLP